jgi:tRNA isopentenyl-2-thiomethyl-A-37 hydroxylase MiaE
MAEVTTPIATTDESRRHLLEQFAERLNRRGVPHPDVSAVVAAARGEAMLDDFRTAEPSAIDESER